MNSIGQREEVIKEDQLNNSLAGDSMLFCQEINKDIAGALNFWYISIVYR